MASDFEPYDMSVAAADSASGCEAGLEGYV